MNPNKRLKIEGLLSIEINDNVSFFAEMIVDSDFGDGADSIQSYYGISFDVFDLIKNIGDDDDDDDQ